jgi:hypothetical protein
MAYVPAKAAEPVASRQFKLQCPPVPHSGDPTRWKPTEQLPHNSFAAMQADLLAVTLDLDWRVQARRSSLETEFPATECVAGIDAFSSLRNTCLPEHGSSI